MGIYYLLIFLLAACSLSIRKHADFSGALDKGQTATINGIFILVVVVAHLHKFLFAPMGYEVETFFDKLYVYIHSNLDQLIVAPFFFYSGYGITEQLGKKAGYLDSFLRKRALTLYLNFLVALLVYILTYRVLCGEVRLFELGTSLIFMHSFGNPTWFLFCTFCCYVSIYWTFRYLNNKHRWALMSGVVALMLCYVVLIHKIRSYWWYSTALVFPFGVFVSLYKLEVERIVSSRWKTCFVAVLVMFCTVFCFRHEILCLRFNFLAILFVSLIVLFTMRVHVGNPILCWCGRHVFPIYMYHALWLFIAREMGSGFGEVRWMAHAMALVVFAATILTAKYYNRWQIQM